MTAYYNEIDPYAAEWLRNLINAGRIAPGYVDERGIEDVKPDELREFTQCHFFAGVGVWSHALRQAGWPDDRPVWTGSCPCQPFSAAGKGAGFTDERHLWPAWFHLITQCAPDMVLGEQVASKDGLGWLDLVQTDLEGAGYANGAVDLCAAGVGAPHIRQRLWFIAERLADAISTDQLRASCGGRERIKPEAFRGMPESDSRNAFSGLADSSGTERGQEDNGRTVIHGQTGKRDESTNRPRECGTSGRLADSEHNGHGGSKANAPEPQSNGQDDGVLNRGVSGLCDSGPGPTNGLWRAADWLYCRDGKWRPVEPGTFPLAHGAAGRVGRLRAYGNAINAEAAKEFIRAYLGGE